MSPARRDRRALLAHAGGSWGLTGAGGSRRLWERPWPWAVASKHLGPWRPRRPRGREVEGRQEGRLQWAPWSLRWGQPAWGPLGSRGASSRGPPFLGVLSSCHGGGMGERGQAAVTGGGAFLLASLFLQPLRWTHPERGGPSPWKAVGRAGPLAPSYEPRPAHHAPHPACPPFTPRPICSPGDGHL